jgi:hypothetical protein
MCELLRHTHLSNVGKQDWGVDEWTRECKYEGDDYLRGPGGLSSGGDIRLDDQEVTVRGAEGDLNETTDRKDSE